MHTRNFVLAALVFFSLAPAALAYGYQANGTSCVLNDGSECQSGVCSGTAFGITKFCQPCTATSCGTGAVCQSDGTCAAAAPAVSNTPTNPVQVDQTPQNPVVAPAATPAGKSVKLINPLKAGASLESFLGDILSFVIRIGTIVVILMLVFVGYKFVEAQGAPGKIEEARKMLLWTVIGALVLLGAQAIASAISATVQAIGG